MFALVASGCASSYRARYAFVLEAVETSSTSTSTSAQIAGLDFKDERILAHWNIEPDQFEVRLSNRSRAPLQFDWKDSGYHGAQLLPAEVAPGKEVKIDLHPLANTKSVPAQCFRATKVSCTPAYVDHNYYLHYPYCSASDLNLKQCGGTVRMREPLLPIISKDRATLEKMRGEKVRMTVPLAAKKYTFVFRVDRVEIEKESARDPPPEGVVSACPCKKKYRSDEP